jgi:hypothetical protein
LLACVDNNDFPALPLSAPIIPLPNRPTDAPNKSLRSRRTLRQQAVVGEDVAAAPVSQLVKTTAASEVALVTLHSNAGLAADDEMPTLAVEDASPTGQHNSSQQSGTNDNEEQVTISGECVGLA